MIEEENNHPILKEIDKLELEIQRSEWIIDSIDDEKEQYLEDYILCKSDEYDKKEALMDRVFDLVKQRREQKESINKLIHKKVEKEMEARKLGVNNW